MKCTSTYNDIISVQNLLLAWKDFLKGKRNRKDVQEFQFCLMDNILSLHIDLKQKTYKHSLCEAFNISDPKPRNIHKAKVRDRLLHNALYRVLYPYYDSRFISDSYSCRKNKSTHKALKRFRKFLYNLSKNDTKTCFILKCDIRKFFASIDHKTLIVILEKNISDNDIILLWSEIIQSFHSSKMSVGLPLGNLTSQLLVNIYMNEFDQYMKHVLKVKYYIRYADDFVVLSYDKQYLKALLTDISVFLSLNLKLTLHPNKVLINTFASGVDFLGWIHFPDHRVLRTATKKRMMRNVVQKHAKKEVVDLYVGMLGHGNTYIIQKEVITIVAQVSKIL